MGWVKRIDPYMKRNSFIPVFRINGEISGGVRWFNGHLEADDICPKILFWGAQRRGISVNRDKLMAKQEILHFVPSASLRNSYSDMPTWPGNLWTNHRFSVCRPQTIIGIPPFTQWSLNIFGAWICNGEKMLDELEKRWRGNDFVS